MVEHPLQQYGVSSAKEKYLGLIESLEGLEKTNFKGANRLILIVHTVQAHPLPYDGGWKPLLTFLGKMKIKELHIGGEYSQGCVLGAKRELEEKFKSARIEKHHDWSW